MTKGQVPASDDWRRRGQERFLKGKQLSLRAYEPPRPDWDHDHCAFCTRKLSRDEGDLHRGFATEDARHWVCEDCFADFRAEMQWIVDDKKPPK